MFFGLTFTKILTPSKDLPEFYPMISDRPFAKSASNAPRYAATTTDKIITRPV
jgi:hypothetical protein